nr:MmgE/PrpD family protein [Enterovirga sp. DB1703]
MGTQAPPSSHSGPTKNLAAFVSRLRWSNLPDDVQQAALRHLIDTLGVISGGASTDLSQRVASLLPVSRSGVCVPGRPERFSALDAAYLGGISGHGLELDDGFRDGSVHPGVAVVPALISAAQERPVDGETFMAALVAGYETIATVARAYHPKLRQRGFHPTSAVGPFGSAAAIARLLGFSLGRTEAALGLSSSSAAGTFAFLGGGADVKRLHAGHAAREGFWAATLAQADVVGPPNVLEVSDGFGQSFAGLPGSAPFSKPPGQPFGLSDCYFKPYPCCRHLQPALEGVLAIRRDHALDPQDVTEIQVETYSIAAEHAKTGWDDFASAQLSFPYVLLLGLRFGAVELKHFAPEHLADHTFHALKPLVRVRATEEMDALYPAQRPARVTVKTVQGRHTRFFGEALGSRDLPLSDDRLAGKFIGLVSPLLGRGRAEGVLEALWQLPKAPEVGRLIADLAV